MICAQLPRAGGAMAKLDWLCSAPWLSAHTDCLCGCVIMLQVTRLALCTMQ
jgi:hypothetical protein